jgi:hypothetical protein
VARARDRGSGSRETRRTPGPVAGCNKPAVLRAEETVEVVRNHEGGTRCWTGGAVGPGLFGAAGFGCREAPGPGVDARGRCRWRGRQGHEPQERQGLGARSEFRPRSVHTARGPATVRTLRRRRERSGSAEDERFAAPKRHPGDVLEGPGPATVEGRGGRRKEPTDLPPRPARQRVVRRVPRRPPTPALLAPLRRPRRPPELHRSCPAPRCMTLRGLAAALEPPGCSIL